MSIWKPETKFVKKGAGAFVIQYDARDLPLEDSTVDLIVTSPP